MEEENNLDDILFDGNNSFNQDQRESPNAITYVDHNK